MHWIDLAQDRDGCAIFVNAVMNLPVPQNAGNLTALESISFSRETCKQTHAATSFTATTTDI